MDHIKILKRAFRITLSYRALWVFGILLALTTAYRSGGGGNGGSGGSSGGSSYFPSGHLASLRLPAVTSQETTALISLLILAACAIFLFIIATVILRYLSETALIRMVDIYETTGEKVSVRQGFRLGWSRSSLRIFLIDLLFGLAGTTIFLLLLIIAAAPLLVWLTESDAIRFVGTLISVGMFLLIVFLLILAIIVFSLLIQFIRRACILENLGVFEAIRRGYHLFRLRLSDVILMGILLFALGILLVVLMIPLAIMLGLAAVVLGGLPGLLAGWIASLFAEGAVPWIVAGIVALPIFLLVVIAPLLFLNGLAEVFKSSTWTLAYREIIALETVQAQEPTTG